MILIQSAALKAPVDILECLERINRSFHLLLKPDGNESRLSLILNKIKDLTLKINQGI